MGKFLLIELIAIHVIKLIMRLRFFFFVKENIFGRQFRPFLITDVDFPVLLSYSHSSFNHCYCCFEIRANFLPTINKKSNHP